MRYHHLYSDAQGESHWREVQIDLSERVFAPPAQNILISEPETAQAFVFLRLQAGWDEPTHPSPIPQVLICLQGCVQVTASDGEMREIAKGDVWRMEDLTGKGHHTKVVSSEDFEAAIVQFA
ncbi:MAG: cupin [Paracoccaceae bacterium]